MGRTVPEQLNRARAVLQRFALIKIDDDVVETASSLEPPALRALDAIHLATAHLFRRHVTAVVTYDARLAEAAIALGMAVVAPA